MTFGKFRRNGEALIEDGAMIMKELIGGISKPYQEVLDALEKEAGQVAQEVYFDVYRSYMRGSEFLGELSLEDKARG